MQKYDVNIVVDDTKHFNELVDQLGGPDNVAISITRNKKRRIKSAMIDETLIVAPTIDPGTGLITDPGTTPQDLAQAIYDAHDPEASSITADQNIRIGEKFKEILQDTREPAVFATFKTTDEMSALFYREVWKDMQATPTRWSDKLLTASMDTTNFDIGDDLDTNQKCIDYGAECEALAWDFAITRMQAAEDFKGKRAIIKAE